VQRVELEPEPLEPRPDRCRVTVAIEQRVRDEQHAADRRAERQHDRVGAVIQVTAAELGRIADEERPHDSRHMQSQKRTARKRGFSVQCGLGSVC
jgi:hypothetical protein